MSYSEAEWKPVVGYEKYYAVSSQGKVKRTIDGLRRGLKAGYELQPHLTNQGYLFVALYDRETKRARSTLLHNVVTAAFIGPKPQGMQVNHIDGNKQNPSISNLEYVTCGDNQRHAFCLGLMKKKLNPNLVREIRALQGKLSSRQIAARYDIAPQTVQAIHRRVYWATVK